MEGHMARFKYKEKTPERRLPVTALVVVAVLIVISIFLFMPPSQRINQGLDIQGGISVVMTAETTDGSVPDDEQME